MYSIELFLYLFALAGIYSCLENPRVILKKGIVEGTFKKSYDNRTFLSFKGIPFAKPPIGDLRFEEPIEEEPWTGVLLANKSYVCSQISNVKNSIIGSEDCLYVYVSVPGEYINRSAHYDVIVHIHGGSLTSGSPTAMAMPDYLMDKDVIFVSFNYRLGPAGFLSTGDSVVPGNNGLKDQTLALKWIQTNIEEFGGNPNSVTLTGFSSGSSSAQYHYLSPLSKGLFHRGYTASLAVTNPASYTPIPLQKAKVFAEDLGCPINDNKEMINCLKKIPNKKLANTSIWFKPNIEKGGKQPFLTDNPYRLLKEGKVYDVPVVASNTINESLYMLDEVYKNATKIFGICENWIEWATAWLDLDEFVERDRVVDTKLELKKFYLNDCVNITHESGLRKLGLLLTDLYFMYGADVSIRLQAAAGTSKVYYYLYNYVTEDILQFGGPRVPSHGTDVQLIFKFRENPPQLKPKDEKMMRVFTEFLANYARDGVPRLGDVEWKPIDNGSLDLNVLEIKGPEEVFMTHIHELAPREFWESLPIDENK